MKAADVQAYYNENNFEINQEDENGATPLIAAIASHRIELVETLLALGADVNYNSAKAALPLIVAIYSAESADAYGSEEQASMAVDIIKLLLQFGASPTIIDITEGQNAYEYASENFPDVADLFPQSGGA